MTLYQFESGMNSVNHTVHTKFLPIINWLILFSLLKLSFSRKESIDIYFKKEKEKMHAKENVMVAYYIFIAALQGPFSKIFVLTIFK